MGKWRPCLLAAFRVNVKDVSFMEQWRRQTMWRPVAHLSTALTMAFRGPSHSHSPSPCHAPLHPNWAESCVNKLSMGAARTPQGQWDCFWGIGLDFRPTRRYNSYRLWMGFPAGCYVGGIERAVPISTRLLYGFITHRGSDWCKNTRRLRHSCQFPVWMCHKWRASRSSRDSIRCALVYYHLKYLHITKRRR